MASTVDKALQTYFDGDDVPFIHPSYAIQKTQPLEREAAKEATFIDKYKHCWIHTAWRKL